MITTNKDEINKRRREQYADKRKQLEKSNDVDGSSNTTEDTIIPRKGEHYDVSAINFMGKCFLYTGHFRQAK
ncbi:hypothetical protein Leryth_015430 [Lithospermum erythrorhizon]|nr:hypothetical protein Leryth_015430 [Lithospermum erythrorhizon]